MLPAAMAKPPEHDFAPSWLKIPQGNPISHHPSGDHRSTSKSQFHQDLRPRRAPHDNYHGYAPRPSYSRGIGPPHGKDERRPYPHRQHSADDLITMADSMTLNSPGLFSPQSGFSSESFFPNANQYRGRFGPGTREGSSHGREEGYPGRNQTRGARHSGGRQRYPSGNSHTGSKERPLHPEHRKDSFHPRSSHSEDRSKTSEHVGIRLGKENVGERGKDVGGEKDSSALSRQDFPSLSGDKDEVKETAKPPQPAGAWEKRPATKNIGGRHYKLTQKTTFKDSKDNTPKTSLLSPRSNTTSNPSGNTLSLKLSSQTSTGPPPPASTRGIIPIKSTNGGGNTILLKVTSSPKVTSRKPVTKEPTIVKDKLGAIPNSNGSNNSSSSSSNTSVPSPHVEPQPVKPSKPTPSQPVEVPSPRLILGKPKKGPKNDFIRELRRSTTADGQTCFENGGLEHEDFNYNRASSLNNDLEENEKNLYDNGINSVEITTSLENGYLDSNESWEDTKTSNSTPKLSSSLEAEQRLLREMGWHEHSDNEEGYAPITEDERQEFKLRSQQLKRNGFTKPNLNSIMISSSLPVNAFSQTVIDQDDDCSCSSSDSSEDED